MKINALSSERMDKFFQYLCAVQNRLLFLNQLKLMTVFKNSLALIILITLFGCASDNLNRIPVVRLDNQIKYSQNPNYYYVRPGDTLYSIAWNQDLDYRLLAIKNSIPEPYTIRAGQKLKVRFQRHNRVPIDAPITSKPVVKWVPKNSSHAHTKALASVKKHPLTTQRQTRTTNKQKKTVTKWFWPVKGRVVALFSKKRGGNKGIDIQTTKPMPVKAIAGGRVVYSGQGIRGYGRLIIIKHNDDYLSAYAYNSRIRVKEKDEVKAGQLIADTGLDGLEKNKLHLEIRYRGKPVDPTKYLVKR